MFYRTVLRNIAFAISVIFMTSQRPMAQQQPTFSQQQREAAEAYIRAARAHQTPERRKDSQEISNFRLSMDELTKCVKAEQSLQTLEQQHPELKELSEAQDSPGQNDSEGSHEKTIDETLRMLEKHPEAVSAIRNVGMTPREFLLTVYAMTLNSAGALYKQMGVKELLPGTSEENIAFVQAHKEDIEKLTPKDEAKQPEPQDQ